MAKKKPSSAERQSANFAILYGGTPAFKRTFTEYYLQRGNEYGRGRSCDLWTHLKYCFLLELLDVYKMALSAEDTAYINEFRDAFRNGTFKSNPRYTEWVTYTNTPVRRLTGAMLHAHQYNTLRDMERQTSVFDGEFMVLVLSHILEAPTPQQAFSRNSTMLAREEDINLGVLCDSLMDEGNEEYANHLREPYHPFGCGHLRMIKTQGGFFYV